MSFVAIASSLKDTTTPIEQDCSDLETIPASSAAGLRGRGDSGP